MDTEQPIPLLDVERIKERLAEVASDIANSREEALQLQRVLTALGESDFPIVCKEPKRTNRGVAKAVLAWFQSNESEFAAASTVCATLDGFDPPAVKAALNTMAAAGTLARRDDGGVTSWGLPQL